MMSFGTVQGFGSVIVNGIAFHSADALITIDGEAALESDLRLGMPVLVQSPLDENGIPGAAQSITLVNHVRGPVTNLYGSPKRLMVMGQTVIADHWTVYDGLDSAADLLLGDFVEAAGFQTAGGTLLATRIGRVPEPLIPDESLVSIRGTIDRNLPLSQQFVISGLTIKYDHPDLVLENINLESLAEGIPVWVRGTITAGGVLTAKRIEAGEGLPLSAAPGPGELEGLITAMVSETAFEFEGIPVSFGPDTLFTNGTVKDLALNARLEVEGRKNANGTLSAERVTFTDERMEIEADVESVDLENQTVQLLGLRFDITPLTTFQDDSAARRVPFGFENIIPGNHVRIQGILKDGRFTAGTLTRMLPDSGIVIRGPVDAIQRSFINTMGILVRMGTDTVFLDENNNPVSSEGFLTITRPGDRIAVRGTEGGSLVIDAAQVALER